MNYITTKDAAKKWNIKERRVRVLAKDGRIPDAVFKKGIWHIPEDAIKPDKKIRGNGIRLKKLDLQDEETKSGFYATYGGCFLPVSYVNLFNEIFSEYLKLSKDPEFQKKLFDFRRNIQGRLTPLYHAKNFSTLLNGNELYIKREDLNITGSIYINYVYPMVLLAKHLERKIIYSPCGDANYAESLVYAANLEGIEVEIYIGYSDYKKQKFIFDNLKIKKGRYIIVTEGNQTVYDASNSCLRRYFTHQENAFLTFHEAIGPHPLPYIIEHNQAIIGEEIFFQFRRITSKDPNYVVAPLNMPSNSLPLFDTYLKRTSKLIAVEDENSIVENGKIVEIHGCFSKSVVDEMTAKSDYLLNCPGVDYPVINPKLCSLIDSDRLILKTVNDEEVKEACKLFYELEGFMPSYQDGYALACVIKLSKKNRPGKILMCMSGNGEKDKEYLGLKN